MPTPRHKPPIQIPFNGHGDQLHYESDIGEYPDRFRTANWYKLSEEDPEEYARLITERQHWSEIARNRVWRDNYEFDATMRFTGMSRGRSAAYFHLEDENGHHYTMFMTDILDVVQRCTIKEGLATGRWTFQKRGANFGVRLV